MNSFFNKFYDLREPDAETMRQMADFCSRFIDSDQYRLLKKIQSVYADRMLNLVGLTGEKDSSIVNRLAGQKDLLDEIEKWPEAYKAALKRKENEAREQIIEESEPSGYGEGVDVSRAENLI